MSNLSLNLIGSLLAENNKKVIINTTQNNLVPGHLKVNQQRRLCNREQNSEIPEASLVLETDAYNVELKKSMGDSKEKFRSNVENFTKISRNLVKREIIANSNIQKKEAKKESQKPFPKHELFINPHEKIQHITENQIRVKNQTFDRQKELEKSIETKMQLIKVISKDCKNNINYKHRYEMDKGKFVLDYTRVLDPAYVQMQAQACPRLDPVFRRESSENCNFNEVESKSIVENNNSLSVLSPKGSIFINNKENRKNFEGDVRNYLRKQISDYNYVKVNKKEHPKSTRVEIERPMELNGQKLCTKESNGQRLFSNYTNTQVCKVKKKYGSSENNVDLTKDVINVKHLSDRYKKKSHDSHKTEKSYQENNDTYKQQSKYTKNNFSLVNNMSSPTYIKCDNLFDPKSKFDTQKYITDEGAKYLNKIRFIDKYIDIKKNHSPFLEKKYQIKSPLHEIFQSFDVNNKKQSNDLESSRKRKGTDSSVNFDELWKGDYKEQKVKLSNEEVVLRFIRERKKIVIPEDPNKIVGLCSPSYHTRKMNSIDIVQKSERSMQNSDTNAQRQSIDMNYKILPRVVSNWQNAKANEEKSKKEHNIPLISNKDYNIPLFSNISNLKEDKIGELSDRTENVKKLQKKLKKEKSPQNSWKGDESMRSSFHITRQSIRKSCFLQK